MTKLKSKNVFFSEENIKRLVASESEFQSLKTNRADDYTSMQEKKLDNLDVIIPVFNEEEEIRLTISKMKKLKDDNKNNLNINFIYFEKLRNLQIPSTL